MIITLSFLICLLFVRFTYSVDDAASLVSSECLKEKYTRLSCAKVFCPPWSRCISGRCVCKLPYQCPHVGRSVCGVSGRSYSSLCKAQAVACRNQSHVFSHYGEHCESDHVFEVHLKQVDGKEVVQVKNENGDALVCATDYWDMAAANVVCRHEKGDARGAVATGRVGVGRISAGLQLPSYCMSVRCTGSEFSLAECTLYQPQWVTPNTTVTWVQCHKQGVAEENCSEFHCVNGKCIPWKHTCDGVDHCGDNSDEMCCRGCRRAAFHCESGVCIPLRAVQDGIRNCLGGEDEVNVQSPVLKPTAAALVSVASASEEAKWSDPTDDIRQLRNFTESLLQCGIPNMEYVYKKEEMKLNHRWKRLAGGQEAFPTEIQWQVALTRNFRVHCGGVYLGGCWVLTSAQCVRSKNPQEYQVKLSLWKTMRIQATTDIVPVHRIILHHRYNPVTQHNDIALLQLKENRFQQCFTPNPAVRPVCVPWSTLQFRPGDTCTVSGWGRDKAEWNFSSALKLANVTLNDSCKSYYKDQFHEGMECAGDAEGRGVVCPGDSGGPLVCTDVSGTSYVWGIVSSDQNCGKLEQPDRYTKVAHYFEWIRLYTGWSAVTKYN